MTTPLSLKLLHRAQAQQAVTAQQATSQLARTSQIPYSSIEAGEESVPVQDVLAELPDVTNAVSDHAEDLSTLDPGLDVADDIFDAADSDFATSMRLVEVNAEVQVAQEIADAAAQKALEATETADGKNRIFASEVEPPADEDKPFTQGDMWFVKDTAGSFAGVKVWNGSVWNPFQLVADSLLVPSSIGTALIKDGAMTAEKMNANFFYGREFYGGMFTGGEFRLADAMADVIAYSNTGTTAAGWYWEPNVNPPTVDTTKYHSSPSSLKVATIASDMRRMQHNTLNINVPQDAEGFAEFWVYADISTTIYVYLGTASDPYSMGSASVDVAAGTWQKITTPFLKSGITLTRMSITAVRGSSGVRPTFWVDDIRIVVRTTTPDMGISIKRDSAGVGVVESSGQLGKSAVLRGGDVVVADADGIGTMTRDGGTKITDPTKTVIKAPLIELNGVIHSDRAQKVLWAGALYMHGTQTVLLNELVSEQLTGVVLVWQAFNKTTNQADNSGIVEQFIPKQSVTDLHGCGHYELVPGWRADGLAPSLSLKYVYVLQDRIIGHAMNSLGNATSHVLTKVYGV
ncbi:hypothetical protein G7068_03265 [Leucobacter viscericola]|uniref:Minor tail protein n=1 Tax=Leucobacter viscericola TaxID=2714935 RepID=A0A6G7XCL4_9MICO|nr:hypothetical protein [Leucobacter viscericola]QIK62334.1 hypothetical protein G7068_03265 [Leucobacter viscericola]